MLPFGTTIGGTGTPGEEVREIFFAVSEGTVTADNSGLAIVLPEFSDCEVGAKDADKIPKDLNEARDLERTGAIVGLEGSTAWVSMDTAAAETLSNEIGTPFLNGRAADDIKVWVYDRESSGRDT